MSMNLTRRLTALEEIAEEMRLRPIRDLAAEHGVSFERLMELYEECRVRDAELKAQGLAEPENIAATAARMGITVEELGRRVAHLRERLAGYLS